MDGTLSIGRSTRSDFRSLNALLWKGMSRTRIANRLATRSFRHPASTLVRGKDEDKSNKRGFVRQSCFRQRLTPDLPCLCPALPLLRAAARGTSGAAILGFAPAQFKRQGRREALQRRSGRQL